MPNETIISQAQLMIDEINQEYPVHFAYLFGSQARNEENCLSDIDIGIYFIKDYGKTEEILISSYLMELGKKYFETPVDIVPLRYAGLALQYAVVNEGIPIKESTDSTMAEFESLTLREHFDFQYYSDFYNNAIIQSIKEQTYFGDNHGR